MNKAMVSSLPRLIGQKSSVLIKLINSKTSIQAKRCKPWLADNGDKTLRLDYDTLTEKSVVFDVGGYEGQWASDIFSKYGSTIHVFEPWKKYAAEIEKRFHKNPKIIVHDYGLSNSDRTEKMAGLADGTSIYKTAEQMEEITLRDISTFIIQNKIGSIDLMKINIEGGEYEVLEGLIEHNLIKNIANIQVQFHDFAPDAEKRMKAIQAELAKTHKLTYQYVFVWENWQLKK